MLIPSPGERSERLFDPFFIEPSFVGYSCYVFGFDHFRQDIGEEMEEAGELYADNGDGNSWNPVSVGVARLPWKSISAMRDGSVTVEQPDPAFGNRKAGLRIVSANHAADVPKGHMHRRIDLMKVAIGCLVWLLSSLHAKAEPFVEGRVRLTSGDPVSGAQVLLFDLSDLRSAPLAATTDRSGHFSLPLEGALAEHFELGANYPNPFNPSTLIPYQLPTPMQVRLEVFNLLGQRIATLVEGAQPAGFHTAVWDGTDAVGRAVGAGVYVYRLSGNGVQLTRSMLLIDGQAGISSGGPGGGAAARDAGRETTSVYGLTVSGPGLIPHVNPAFRVEAGMAPLEVVVEAGGSVPPAKVASSGGILGDVDNTGGVDFFDALLVALYSLDASVFIPNNGDISLGDVNADGQVDLSDAWLIAAYLNDPSDPVLPTGIGEPVAATASLSPDPSTVTFADDGAWHRFLVEADEAVSVVVNPGGTPPGLEITTRSGRGNYCPAETDDDVSRENGQAVYLSGCAAGEATVELRRESDSTVLRTYTFEVTGSPADLVVESISVSDRTLTPGQSFTLSATVRNQGTGQSAATTLQYYRSSNRTISTRDTRIGTDAVSALAAAATSAESIRLTAPSSEGTYYYGACVVSAGGESAGNNCSRAVTVTVNVATEGAGTGGDSGTGGEDRALIIQSVEVSDNNLTAGQSFEFEITVHNQGANAVSSGLNLFRSTDATIDGTDAYIGSIWETTLRGGETRTVSLDWIAPPYPGTYFYGFCDSQYFYSKNCSTGLRVRVEGSEGGTPDIVVHPPVISHGSLTPGGKFTLTTTFENIGTGRAAATTMRFYTSDDATIDATDTDWRTTRSSLRSLDVGHRQINRYSTSVPFEAGTYYFGWCVDPTLGETNTNNNCSTGVPVTVVLEGGRPDLIVVAPSILDHKPAAGEFRLWATVRNVGSGPSDRTTLHYYRSDDATIEATDALIRTQYILSLAIEGRAGLPAVYHPNELENVVTAPRDPGTYYYGACVEPVPGESDTNNNCSEPVPMNVRVPDLAVGLIWVSTSVSQAGQSFTLRATVRNQGPDEAAATTLRYYRSDNAAIDASDTPIGTDAVRSLTAFEGLASGPGSRLAPSGTSRQAIRVRAPSSPGTYYYGACSDAVPNETNTDNNCSLGAYVRVVPSGEDPFNIELVMVGDFTDPRKDVMQQAARRWETILTEGLPDVDFSGNPFDFFDDDGRVTMQIDDTVDDLRILVYKDDLGGPVGHGGPNFVRSGNPTGLPVLGHISIDSGFLARRQQWEPLWVEERLLRDLMVHEIAHVLGFGPLWTDFGLRHGSGMDSYFGGEQAIEAFNAAGGGNYSGKKIPLEFGLGGGGCGEPSHWRGHVFRGLDREFGAEIMEPTMEREHALSAITIQSLADLGYVVDISRADPYRLPVSVSTAQPPSASAKPVASYGEFDRGALGTIYVGDEQGQIIGTISRE